MAALCFCLWFILNLTLVTGQSVYYVFKGREAILTPALLKPPNNILWKHNGDKVITFDGADERVFEPFKGRVTLAWDTAQLTITDVRYEDSGEYELDAIISERFYRSQYKLKVIDEVSKPVIRCEMNDENSNSNITSATLYCSSSSNTPEALTFIWNLEGKSERGQTLPITLGNEHDDIKYSCTVNNHLHKETSSFMAKDCYTERTYTIVIVIVSIILLVVFSIIFQHRIKRACSKMVKNDDVEKQLNGAGPKRDESDRKGEGEPLIESDIDQKETKSSSQVQRGKGNDIGGKATSASLNSSVQKPAPDPGHMASGGDMDLQQKELKNVTTTEEAGVPQSPNSEPQDNHEINATPSEQRSSEQTEPEEQPDEHHKDPDNEKKMEEAGSSSFIQTPPESTKTPEQTDAELPQFPPQSSTSPVGPVEPESKEQTNPDANLNTDQPKTDPLSEDPSNHEGQLKESQMSPVSETGEGHTLPSESRDVENKDHDKSNTEQQKQDSPRKSSENNAEKTDPEKTGNGNDTGENATSPPASLKNSVQKPAPDPGHMASGGDMDLQHEELGNDPATEEAGEPQSPNSEPQDNHEINATPSEQRSSEQTEPEEQPDEHHKDPDGKKKMEEADSSDSIQTESTKTPEQTDAELPQSPGQSSTSPVGPVEPESKEQTNPDANLNTDQVQTDPLSEDPSNHEGQLKDSQMSPVSETGEDQTLPSESSDVEDKVHDKSNTEQQKQDSPRKSSENNAEKADPEKTAPKGKGEGVCKKPAPDPGHMASGGDMDLQQEELKNVTTTEEAGDTHSDESDEDKYEDALGNGNDTGESATSPTASPKSSVQNSTPDSELKASGGEMDFQHEEFKNVTTTEEAGDRNSNHSDQEEYVDAVSQTQPGSTESKDQQEADGEDTGSTEKNLQKTQQSETSEAPEPGNNQTPPSESSDVEDKVHDKSNTEKQKQDSPSESSENNVENMATEKTALNLPASPGTSGGKTGIQKMRKQRMADNNRQKKEKKKKEKKKKKTLSKSVEQKVAMVDDENSKASLG